MMEGLRRRDFPLLLFIFALCVDLNVTEEEKCRRLTDNWQVGRRSDRCQAASGGEEGPENTSCGWMDGWMGDWTDG